MLNDMIREHNKYVEAMRLAGKVYSKDLKVKQEEIDIIKTKIAYVQNEIDNIDKINSVSENEIISSFLLILFFSTS